MDAAVDSGAPKPMFFFVSRTLPVRGMFFENEMLLEELRRLDFTFANA